MTPQDPDAGWDEDGTDEAGQDEVRRLLADAAAAPADPLPPEVAARLDDVLAGLVAERATPIPDTAPDTVPVARLEDRRRRLWPRLVLAAAAVVVAGYGGSAALHAASDGSADNSATDSADSAGGSTSSGDAPGNTLSDRAVPEAGPRAAARTGERALRAARLRADVVALLEGPRGATSLASEALADRGCTDPPRPADSTVQQVTLDAQRAVLVVGPRGQAGRTATVYACATGAPLASVPVPPAAGR